MTGRNYHFNQPFRVLSLVTLLLIGTTIMLLPACGETKVNYPWKTIVSLEAKFSGFTIVDKRALEVSYDPGKELSEEEQDTLTDNVTLIDNSGKVYSPFITHFEKDRNVNHEDEEGNITLEWHADYSYTYIFIVDSIAATYEFHYKNYPPLDIGNPFETPFLQETK